MQTAQVECVVQVEDKTVFNECMMFVFKWEGGYVNHPKDPGGETKYGICKRWYPHLDIKNLTREDAMKIYYEDYWLKAGCDNMLYPANLIVFDTAVHMGVYRALDLWNDIDNWYEYILRRIAAYTSMPGAKTFLAGWINRCIALWKEVKSKGGK